MKYINKKYTNDLLLTKEAADMLRRSPQTLRKWACTNKGPIKPIRTGGPLLWRREDIVNIIINRCKQI